MPEKKSSPLLNVHRDLVRSTTRVPPAVMFGSSFAVAMGLFAWIGHRIDQSQGTAPLATLAGITLGLGYGAYEVWKMTRSGGAGDPPHAPKDPDHAG